MADGDTHLVDDLRADERRDVRGWLDHCAHLRHGLLLGHNVRLGGSCRLRLRRRRSRQQSLRLHVCAVLRHRLDYSVLESLGLELNTVSGTSGVVRAQDRPR